MEQLGIEPKLLLAQIVNFGIILLLLNKLLYKPILTMLEKRRKEIAAGLKLTEELRQEEEKLTIKREKALSKARDEAVKILEEAKVQAKELEKEIVAASHEQANKIVKGAKEEAEMVKKQLEKDLKASAVNLAVVMSKRLLGTVLSDRNQREIIDRHIKELEHWVGKQKS